MRKVVSILVLACLATSFAGAQPGDSSRLAVSIAAGWQHDDFRWSIAGNSQGQDPNIYSELIYKTLQGPALNASARFNISDAIALQAAISASNTTHGTATDTDYLQDNRTTPTYQGEFDSNEGHTWQWQAMAGYAFVRTRGLRLTVWVGYGIYNQRVYLVDNDGSTDANLRSSYNTRWRGPAGSLVYRITFSPRLFTALAVTYHHTGYRAQANWNRIDTFNHPLSFEQTAKGYRADFSLAPNFVCNRHLAIFISGNYTTTETGKGIDRLYLKSGDRPETQFNGAKGTAFRAGVGVTVIF